MMLLNTPLGRSVHSGGSPRLRPSAVDPLTGEIIAGKAYVYGAAVNEWAAHAVDVIRFFDFPYPSMSLSTGDNSSKG